MRDGLEALGRSHRALIDEDIRKCFLDSIDIDEALRDGREAENRWDYLLGHGPTRRVVALEPHAATTGEVGAVIRKRAAALRQLRGHLREDARIAEWFWVATGRVDFVPHDRQILRLQQAGIAFVGGRLRARHLDDPAVDGRRSTPRRRRPQVRR